MFSCFEKQKLKYPAHVAVIPDGNRRYSQRMFRNTMSGHQKSTDTLHNLVNWCLNNKIAELSVFAWSSENWSRPQSEVSSAMRHFSDMLDKWLTSEQSKVSFHFVSTSPHKIDAAIRTKMNDLRMMTREHSDLKCYIYVSYGFIEDVERAQMGDFRVSSAVPSHASDPDVLIRTSGEQRLSNFCMWHLRYTELIFVSALFPDCDDEVWDDCVVEFNARQRRFGH